MLDEKIVRKILDEHENRIDTLERIINEITIN